MLTDKNRSTPVVVLASRAPETTQQLETSLYSAGYRVVTTKSERETFEKVRSHSPDAVVLDRAVSDAPYTFCRTLRDDPALSPATPLVMSQREPPTGDQQVEALRAGAWHLQGPLPLGHEELLLRLAIYLEAKLEIDNLTAECLVDRPSGLYNSQGFTQRAVELAALTSRQGSAAACVVFRPEHPLPTPASGDRLGRVFKAAGRLSDAIGRTAAAEFAVFAPATNDSAAGKLVSRMRDNVARKGGVALRAAYSAATATRIDARALLERARQALQTR